MPPIYTKHAASHECVAGGTAIKQHFKYLWDEREDLEADKRQQEESERRERERERHLQEAKAEAAAQYDTMVRGVLEQLREVAYPDLEVHRTRTAGFDMGWGIGSRESSLEGGRDSETRVYYWADEVEVTPLFDANSLPSEFECRRGRVRSSRRKCGLSEMELVEALRELHPPGSAKFPK